MADFWIKLYHEIIDDPKMATMPDRLWRRTIEIFLLAGKLSKDKSGKLPDTNQLAWLLRMNTDELALDLKQLESCEILQRTTDGWLVVNFEKRQSATSDTERKKQQREREHHEKYYGNVTNLSRNVTQSTEYRIQKQNTETEENARAENLPENDKESDKFRQVRRWIETSTGVLGDSKSAIDVIDRLVLLDVVEDDIKNGVAWYVNNTKKQIRYYSQIEGPITTAHNKRLQSITKQGVNPYQNAVRYE